MELLIRDLGQVAYQQSWDAMKAFTDIRGPDNVDEIWLLEHPAIYTLGQAGKPEHVLAAGDIPVVKVDRGGQVTYHGPGQLVVYLLLDLKRLGIGVRDLVSVIEEAIIAVLKHYDISAYAKPDAPGVYVDEAKIAALGLRVRRGCSFHGLSLNVDCELAPFLGINPCGYAGMAVTRLADLAAVKDLGGVQALLIDELYAKLGYTSRQITHAL